MEIDESRDPAKAAGVVPRAKLFLSTETVEGVFGSGKWRLLDCIQREGSLRKAALSLGRSYRKAWGDIRRAEQGLGRQLVIRVRGGNQGGATTLTDFGKELLRAWDRHYRQVMHAVEVSYKEHLRGIVATEQERRV